MCPGRYHADYFGIAASLVKRVVCFADEGKVFLTIFGGRDHELRNVCKVAGQC